MLIVNAKTTERIDAKPSGIMKNDSEIASGVKIARLSALGKISKPSGIMKNDSEIASGVKIARLSALGKIS